LESTNCHLAASTNFDLLSDANQGGGRRFTSAGLCNYAGRLSISASVTIIGYSVLPNILAVDNMAWCLRWLPALHDFVEWEIHVSYRIYKMAPYRLFQRVFCDPVHIS
jgi:hypothetical protein